MQIVQISEPTLVSETSQSKDSRVLESLLGTYDAKAHYMEQEKDTVLEFDYLIEDDNNNAINISGAFHFVVSEFQCSGNRNTPSYSEIEVTLTGIDLGECVLFIDNEPILVDSSEVESILIKE